MGTPGGDSQDQQVLNVLLNVIIFHQELPVAINGPRINTPHPHSSFDNHTDAPAQLDIESRIAVAVQDALRARGNVQRVLTPYGMNSGGVAVGVNPQTATMRGGADLRRERDIVGWQCGPLVARLVRGGMVARFKAPRSLLSRAGLRSLPSLPSRPSLPSFPSLPSRTRTRNLKYNTSPQSPSRRAGRACSSWFSSPRFR